MMILCDLEGNFVFAGIKDLVFRGIMAIGNDGCMNFPIGSMLYAGRKVRVWSFHGG